MVGMMLLKSIYNLSDEGVVARWLENPYMQYFTGEKVFQKRPQMNPIDMTKFRKRIGEKGVEKIFKISLMVNAKEILTDRGYRGKKLVGSIDILIPTSGSSKQSYYEKRKARKKFCKRAGIEPVIGHLKSDHRMMRNYLKGTLGDAINTMMAAAAYNMRHWMNKHALSSFVSWLLTLVRRLENVLFENENQYAWKDSTLAMVAK
jgi:IS5 family transposase